MFTATSYHNSAELEELKSSNTFIDLTRYGISASIISGGVGMVNTFGAIANAFGADYKEITTARALDNMGMKATAAYARANSTGVDFAGAVVGSLVPGFAGIKLIRGAQAGLRAYQGTSKTMKGLSSALVPADRVKDVVDGLHKGTHSMTTQFNYTMAAMKQGFHQNIVEAAAAETAILLTMNQHTTFNDADLGYWGSIKENLGSAAIGLALGGGIGGLATGLAHRNEMYGALKSVLGDVRQQADLLLTSKDIGLNAGDAIAIGIDRVQEIKANIAAAQSGKINIGKTVLAEMQKSVDYLQNKVDEAVNRLVMDNYTTLAPDYAAHTASAFKALARHMPENEAANFFGHAAKVKAFNQTDTAYGPNIASVALYDDVESLAAMRASNHGLDYATLGIEGQAKFRREAEKSWLSTYGFAYTHKNNAEIKAAVLNHPDVEASKKMFTLRHEVGHLKGSELAKVMETKYGQQFMKELEAVGREARPHVWADYDAANAAIPTLRTQLKAALKSGDQAQARRLAGEIQWHTKNVKYATNPDELIADAIAMFDDPKKYTGLTQKYKMVDGVLHDNAILRARLGENTTYIDLYKYDMFKQVDREPTIADLGPVKMVGKAVLYGKDSKRVDTAKAFDPMKATAEEASAYYYAAFKTPYSLKDKNVTIGANDFPSAMRVLYGVKQRATGEQFAGKVSLADSKGIIRNFDFTVADNVPKELERFKRAVLEQKSQVAEAIRKRSNTKGSKNVIQETELARLLDTDIEWATLSSLQRMDPDYKLIGEPWWSDNYRPDLPTMAKIEYNTREAADPLLVKSMQDIQERTQAVYQQVATDIQGFLGTKLQGTKLDILPPSSMTGINRLSATTPYHQTQSLVASANPDYGSPLEYANSVGTQFNQPIKHAGHKLIDEELMPLGRTLAADKQGLAEYATLDSVLRQAKYKEVPEVWRQEGGIDAWFYSMFKENVDPKLKSFGADKRFELTADLRAKLKTMIDAQHSAHLWQKDLESAIQELALKRNFSVQNLKELEATVADSIKGVSNPNLVAFFRGARKSNELVVEGSMLAAKNRGKEVSWDKDVWYPGRLNRERYDLIAIVRPVEHGLFGQSKMAIIGAPNQAALDAKLAQAKAALGDKIHIDNATSNAERHKNRLADYDEALDIDEYFMEYGNKNEGLAWDLMPDATPQLIQHRIDDMKKQWSGVTDQLTKQHYAEEFTAIEALEEARMYGSNRYGAKEAEASVYQDYESIMLNRPNSKRFQNWRGAQQSADKVFSTVWNTVVGSIKEARGKVTTADYQEMNTLARQYGLPQVYGDHVGEYIVRTESVSDSVLADIVPQMNWFGATTMLRLDLIQPIVNSVSMPILSVPEIKHLVDALPALRKEHLMNSLTTGAVNEAGEMLAKDFSNTKLYMQATHNWFTRADLREQYKIQGLITEKGAQYFQSIDQAALVSKSIAAKSFEDAKIMAGKAVDLGSKLTDTSEDFTRFLAADMARMVLEAGGIGGATLQLAQRTYVNRVIGNYTYAQRPALFQGFAGQAIGLFQTYQFNLTQQLLRHLGDKPSRAMALMGIQSATFGLNSTPGFELLNQHIFERSNYEGDFYTGLQETIGTNPMEWVMYGAASNFTKLIHSDGIDLYSRGNLTPRTATIVPTSLEDIVVVNMATKALGSLGTAMNNLAGGVPVMDTLYQAMATNGINRPLQGIGQLLAGERTTRQGSMLLDTSDLDWMQRTARIMGARGLNEAIAVSNYYRAVGFESSRNKSIEADGRIVKQQILADNFDGASYEKFMQEYTKKGGDIDYYDRWISNLYGSATQSQIYDMNKQHNKPEGRYMQKVMGGNVEDYINPFKVPE